jgi:hypothetical protein
MTDTQAQPYAAEPVNPPRKRHRVFLWFFLAVQLLFVVLIVVQLTGNSGHGADAHAQALSYCAGNGWSPLYTSYQQCVTSYGNLLNGAGDVGNGIGVGLIIGLWVGVDIILGVGRFVVVTTRKRR